MRRKINFISLGSMRRKVEFRKYGEHWAKNLQVGQRLKIPEDPIKTYGDSHKLKEIRGRFQALQEYTRIKLFNSMDDRAFKMSGGYTSLPTSHLPGSVPAAVLTDHKESEIGEANLQTFPPSNGQGRMWGYQPPHPAAADPSDQPRVDGDGNAELPNRWKGFFSIASYRPYYNVDTFDVVDRILSSLYIHHGDFIEKTAHNPDMYGPVWISTTLVFVVVTIGNCASYLSFKPSSTDTQWAFDINYVNWAAAILYGYLCLVPLGFYFLLQYFGIASSLVQLWCLYGYSLFIFIPASFLLIIPTEFLRWTVTALVGLASAVFVALNMRSYTRIASDKWTIAVVSAFALQLCLALAIKLYFFV